jgi:hypothetical protein
MQLVLSKDEKRAPCVFVSILQSRIVYALWEGYRNGHSMSSGGKGSGMYKSIDGGAWKAKRETRNASWNPQENGNRCVSSKFESLVCFESKIQRADCIDLMMQVSTGN